MSAKVTSNGGPAADVPKSLSNLFNTPRDVCQRCQSRVYQVEKVGPVNEVVFHKQCFRCTTCGQVLSLKTYFTNHGNVQDKEIYCKKCKPATTMAGYDANALGIRAYTNVPTVNMRRFNEIRGGQAPHVGLDASHISNPMMAQKQFGHKYKQSLYKHNYPAYVNKGREKVYEAQEELERQQREEEDRLLEEFHAQRAKEAAELQKEIDSEWESRLKELTKQFDEDGTKKKGKGDDKPQSTALEDGESSEALTVKYEQEKENLKKNMTVKLKEKKQAMTMRLQKKEQQETSKLVTEHSEQMLELLRQKQAELRQELMDGNDEGVEEAIAALSLHQSELPPPHAPVCRKRDLYEDPAVFEELDNDVIKVAQEEQATFTELVRLLTLHCITDLQKARACFRWITVKDLNVLEFEDNYDTDTPMGLLRGIKFGTETYHTLFMRLCSYCGLACKEIKGHSKSVGYEPGLKIREENFQNTWNAVLIDGDWWPVQCNWGARHLVLNKDPAEKPKKASKQDKIRYQYDEHYFLTDPDEFIQEFWAQDLEWQLLDQSISLEEFESMPFVRSVFFHYALEFDKTMKSVVTTDNKGGAEVRIRVPVEYVADLVFHYQIRFADRERRNDTEFKGAKLERFVFHSLVDGIALFSVHVPTPASYFLEIFANKIDESNKIGDDPNATMMPFRLKCACKFKIVCDELVGKMHPLPNCASGEWGPSKGARHFNLKAITHLTGVVNVDNEAEIKFKLPQALHFLCKLRMNGVEDHNLEKFVQHKVQDNHLLIRVRPPKPGQFGLDIYARPEDAADNHTLAHACKYLLNCTQVAENVEVPAAKTTTSSKMTKERWGPSPHFDELGLKVISHKEAIIEKQEPGPLTIELGISGDTLKFSFHLIREPDTDCRERVTLKDSGKKVKFILNLEKPGNYLFAIYSRKKKEAEDNMENVFNYMIKFPEESATLKKKKSKSLFAKK